MFVVNFKDIFLLETVMWGLEPRVGLGGSGLMAAEPSNSLPEGIFPEHSIDGNRSNLNYIVNTWSKATYFNNTQIVKAMMILRAGAWTTRNTRR